MYIRILEFFNKAFIKYQLNNDLYQKTKNIEFFLCIVT